MAVRYRNKKSGSVSTYAQSIPRLEKSKDWERVEDPKSTSKPAEKKSD